MKINYLGNEFLKEDSLAVETVRKLKERYKGKIDFEKIDTFEKLIEFEENQIFMDVCKNLKKVRVVTDIDKFLEGKKVSAHDVDFGFFLKLNKELGKIKKVQVICLPLKPYKGLIKDVDNAIEGMLNEK